GAGKVDHPDMSTGGAHRALVARQERRPRGDRAALRRHETDDAKPLVEGGLDVGERVGEAHALPFGVWYCSPARPRIRLPRPAFLLPNSTAAAGANPFSSTYSLLTRAARRGFPPATIGSVREASNPRA